MGEDKRTDLPDGTPTTTYQICVPSADLMTVSGIGTQALMGQRFGVIETIMGGAKARGALYSILAGVERVDYIGDLPTSALAKVSGPPTHRVSAVIAAVFAQANIKSKLLGGLPRNARVRGQLEGDFLRLVQEDYPEGLNAGFIHQSHLSRVSEPSLRPYVEIAADMLGLPYIWGGTGHIGVDCSGLVQSALAAIGIDAPRDTDQQEAALGREVELTDRKVGDLLFWPGHVGIVAENDQLLHANAYHMCVAIEPAADAIARIGDVRRVKRPT